MRFWLREVAGWFLVIIGVLTFYGCYELLIRGRVVETGTLTVIGIFLFRGGIHLLKMAVAAQVCLQAQARLEKEKTGGNNTPPPPRFPLQRGIPNRRYR
ncbi:MAG TPA: hypothetical protein VGY77_12740 [Gemmataceae bacterium]|nr:hypothetical protein [Gemmataceae bacterium]